MTGHKDIKLADHYSTLNEDDQKKVTQKIIKHTRVHQVQPSNENVTPLFGKKHGLG